jgi:hypothetical protein
MGVPFRRWLSNRLLGTEFASIPIADDKIDEVAKKIGVDPDLLVEVRMRARVLRATDGVQDPMGVMRKGTRHVQQILPMPEEIHKAWREECDFRGVDGSALMRSLIHAYLLGKEEPTQVLRQWVYRGKTYKLPDRNNRYKFRERCMIPHGAKRALMRRAHRRGSTISALMRALVLEAMAGKHRTLTLIESRSMYDDEDRYYLGGSIGES